jgi:hypothetical protein
MNDTERLEGVQRGEREKKPVLQSERYFKRQAYEKIPIYV